jgi:phage gp29-like protein
MNLLKKVFSLKSSSRRKALPVIRRNIVAMAQSLPVHDEWLDDEEIARIDEDATVTSSVSIRQSATLRKELKIRCDDEELRRHFAKALGHDFLQRALDIPLQGFGVFELVWSDAGGRWLPTPIERDYRLFALDDSGTLRYLPDDIVVSDLKAAAGVYRPKFNRPMGRPLYKTLFWLTRFKYASTEFWLEFMERFSSPWVVGSTDGDKDEMAENLYAMLAGDVAVVEAEDTVELVTPDQRGNFGELSKYADNQIREALLGGNLMGENTGGSLAATQEHNRVREDIAMADEMILRSLLEQIRSAFIRVNAYAKELEFALLDADDPHIEISERDLRIHQMSGGTLRPTKEYLERTYHIELEPTGSAPRANVLAFSSAAPSEDHISSQVPGPDELAPVEEEILDAVGKALEGAGDYEEALTALERSYPDWPTEKLRDSLAHYLANADLYGRACIERENPKG